MMNTSYLSIVVAALLLNFALGAEARMLSMENMTVFSMCETYEECDPEPPENPDDLPSEEDQYPPI